MSQNWKIDPVTGDYVIASGAPIETNSLTVPAYVRLRAPRGGWLYAPDAEWGSNLAKLKKRRSTGDASEIESTAAEALQPMADDGRASNIDITANFANRQAAGLDVKITDSQGETDELNLEKIGI